MTARWDSDLTMKFILEYKLHECLWNPNSPGYKSKQQREAAYEDLVATMNLRGFGVPEAKTKIKNLRSTYFQERKKIANSIKTANGIDGIYVPNLKWFGELDAILHETEQRKLSLDNTNEEEDEVEVFQDTSISQNVTEMIVDSASASQHPSPTVARLAKEAERRSYANSRLVAELKQLQESVQKDIPTNQFDIFGSSVAAQLKSLPYDKALLAQSQIQTLLTNIAVEDYRSNVISEESESILP